MPLLIPCWYRNVPACARVYRWSPPVVVPMTQTPESAPLAQRNKERGIWARHVGDACVYYAICADGHVLSGYWPVMDGRTADDVIAELHEALQREDPLVPVLRLVTHASSSSPSSSRRLAPPPRRLLRR